MSKASKVQRKHGAPAFGASPLFPRESAEQLLAAGELRPAIEALIAWRQLEPGPEPDRMLTDTYLRFAEQLASRGSDADLVDVLQRGVDLFPDAAALSDSLLAALYRLGRFERAASLLRRRAAHRPLPRTERHDLALALLAAGQTAEALALVPDEGREARDGQVLRALAEMLRGRHGVAFGHVLEARRIGGDEIDTARLEGALQERLGLSDQAEQTLTQAVCESPDDAVSLLLLGNLQAARGARGEAEELWQRAAQLSRPASPLGRKLGCFRHVDLEGATPEAAILEACANDRSLDPNGSISRTVRLRLAVQHARSGGEARAVAELEALVREDGNGPVATMAMQNIALCNEKLERQPAAIRAWERLLAIQRDRGEATPETETILLTRIATIHLSRGDAVRAARELSNALTHGPVDSKTVESIIERLHDTKGRCDECRNLFEQALGRAGEDKDLLQSAAEFCMEHQMMDRAERLWERLLQLEPAHPAAVAAKFDRLARKLTEQIRNREVDDSAIRLRLDELLALRSDDPSTLAVSAKVALRQGDRERALREWREAIWHATADDLSVLEQVADAVHDASDEEKAACHSLLAERCKDDPWRGFMLGLLMLESDPARAESLLKRAMDLPGKAKEDLNTAILRVLYDSHAVEIGLELARHALESFPQSPRFMFLLGAFLEEAGEDREARAVDRAALKLARAQRDTVTLELAAKIGRFGRRTLLDEDEIDFDDFDDFEDSEVWGPPFEFTIGSASRSNGQSDFRESGPPHPASSRRRKKKKARS